MRFPQKKPLTDMDPLSIERYTNREVTIKGLAREEGVRPDKIRTFLTSVGVEIHPPGKPSANPTPNGRGPKHENIPPIDPRYSCYHERVPGYPQCPRCDRCQCPPGKRIRWRKVSGLWVDRRCGKLIEP